MPNDLKTFREAGVDAFTGGFQVGAARTYKRMPQIWANSDLEIRKVLLTAFPRQATNPKQRAKAGRWLRVIHYYFRLGYTRVQIAEEMGNTVSAIHTLIRSINRVRKGKMAKNGKPRGLKPPGRPKKIGAL